MQKIPVTMARQDLGDDAVDDYIHQVKNKYDRSTKKNEWFPRGAYWRWLHQKCRNWCEDACFNRFFTVVILAGSIALGVSVNDYIDDTQTWYIESVFLFFFSIELSIRIMGSILAPWSYPGLWVDAFVVLVSAIDLWFLRLAEIAGIGHRMQVSAIMTLRLMRFWRLVHFTERLTGYARPVRVMRGTLVHTPGLILAMLAMWVGYMYLSALVLRSGAQGRLEGEDVWQEYFGTTGNTMLTMLCVVSSSFKSKEITKEMDEVGEEMFDAVAFRLFTFIAKFFVMNIVLGVFVERLIQEGDFDDELTEMLRVRKDFDIEELREVLKTCKPHFSEFYVQTKKQDLISVGSVQTMLMNCREGRHTWKKDSYRRLFGMNAEDALQLLREADKKNEGFVVLNNFILDVYIKQCAPRSISDMVMSHDLRQSGVLLAQNHIAVCDLMASLNKREERLPRDRHWAGRHSSDGHFGAKLSERREAERGHERHGLQPNVETALGSIVQRRTEAETVFSCIDDMVGELVHGVRDLNTYISGTDWSTVEDVPDVAIQLASIQFQSSLQFLTEYLEMWSEASLAAHEKLEETFNLPCLDDDEDLPICMVCGHRHQGADCLMSA